MQAGKCGVNHALCARRREACVWGGLLENGMGGGCWLGRVTQLLILSLLCCNLMMMMMMMLEGKTDVLVFARNAAILINCNINDNNYNDNGALELLVMPQQQEQQQQQQHTTTTTTTKTTTTTLNPPLHGHGHHHHWGHIHESKPFSLSLKDCVEDEGAILCYWVAPRRLMMGSGGMVMTSTATATPHHHHPHHPHDHDPRHHDPVMTRPSPSESSFLAINSSDTTHYKLCVPPSHCRSDAAASNTTTNTNTNTNTNIDPRYGVDKRLVPTGPNPLHN